MNTDMEDPLTRQLHEAYSGAVMRVPLEEITRRARLRRRRERTLTVGGGFGLTLVMAGAALAVNQGLTMPGPTSPAAATSSQAPLVTTTSAVAHAEADRHCGQHVWNTQVDPSDRAPAPTTLVYLGGADDGARAFGNDKFLVVCLWSRDETGDGATAVGNATPSPIGDPVDLFNLGFGYFPGGVADYPHRFLAWGRAPAGTREVDVRANDGSTIEAVLAAGYYWAYGPPMVESQVTAYYADSATAMWLPQGGPWTNDLCAADATEVLAHIRGADPRLPALLFTGPHGLRIFGDDRTLVACSANGGRVWTRLTGSDDPATFTAHLQGREFLDNWVTGHAPAGTSEVRVQFSDGTTISADLRAGYYLARWPDKPLSAVVGGTIVASVVPTAIIAETPTQVYTLRDGVVTTTPL
jgi:hypothetical protein